MPTLTAVPPDTAELTELGNGKPVPNGPLDGTCFLCVDLHKDYSLKRLLLRLFTVTADTQDEVLDHLARAIGTVDQLPERYQLRSCLAHDVPFFVNLDAHECQRGDGTTFWIATTAEVLG